MPAYARSWISDGQQTQINNTGDVYSQSLYVCIGNLLIPAS